MPIHTVMIASPTRLDPAAARRAAQWVENESSVLNQSMHTHGPLTKSGPEMIDFINRYAVELAPGTVLWRGGAFPTNIQSWNEPAYLSCSERRSVGEHFMHAPAWDWDYADNWHLKPQLARIHITGSMRAVMLGQMMRAHLESDDCTYRATFKEFAREDEVVLLPCHMRITSFDGQAVHIEASSSS